MRTEKNRILPWTRILVLFAICSGCAPVEKWSQIKDTTEPDVLVDFIRTYPNDAHFIDAENKLEKLLFEKEFAALVQLPRFISSAETAKKYKDEFVSRRGFPAGCDDPVCRELLIWSLAQAKRTHASTRHILGGISPLGAIRGYGPFHMEVDAEKGEELAAAGCLSGSGTIMTTTAVGENCALKIISVPTDFGMLVATGAMVINGFNHESAKLEGIRGSITIEKHGGSLVARTVLPSDRLVFDISERIIALPNGPGTIIGINGKGINYFRDYTFESTDGTSYFVLLNEGGLCYLAGKATISSTDKTYQRKFP